MLAHIILWTIAFLYGVTIPLNISMIGKPRRPLTHGVAIGAVLISLTSIAGLVYVSSRL